MTGAYDFISIHERGVRLVIKARPASKSARGAPRIVAVGEGRHALEIAVAAPAHKGQANRALLEFLADQLGLAKTAVSIKTGAAGRLKLIEISGPPRELYRRLLAWLEGLGVKATSAAGRPT